MRSGGFVPPAFTDLRQQLTKVGFPNLSKFFCGVPQNESGRGANFRGRGDFPSKTRTVLTQFLSLVFLLDFSDLQFVGDMGCADHTPDGQARHAVSTICYVFAKNFKIQAFF